MSSLDDKKSVRRVLQETRDCYRIGAEHDYFNADYAEFASSQALADFRHAFGQPDMTCEELCQMLRRASNKERRRQCKTPWAMFMANYLERNPANSHMRH